MNAYNALFTAKAQNSGRKRIGIKDLFDADKARKQSNAASGVKKDEPDLTRFRKAQQAMKAYYTKNMQKGG